MTALNKQAGAGDVSQKTYYIHPAAFGSTKDPGHGHVPVVKADDFEKLRSKLEAAEKRIAEFEAEKETLRPVGVRSEGGHFGGLRIVSHDLLHYGQGREYTCRVNALMTALLFMPEPPLALA
ncbi:hypothetical protein [Citrobacter braakii]|uniref:hypothetical protein n=1 Tax=Citrobacter braakii TaxID=57706 RepID=UPI001E3F271C|nr:hypothetical protein [Citrobacter braakii]